MAEARLVVGLVRGVHGLRGAVRVEVLTDNEARFEVGSVLYTEGSERSLTVAGAQRDGPGLLVRFKEITDRPAADDLRNKYLEADPAELPAGTYFWHDIVGCAVTTLDGADLGTVAEVFRVGHSEVYAVRGERGETLVPAVSAVVRSIDVRAKAIVVDGAALGLGEKGEQP